MTYQQFRDKQQQKINAFPFLFAFNEKQLEEGKKKLGILANSDLLSIGCGGFIAKKDKEAFTLLYEGVEKETREFLSCPDNLLEAFEYELGNHEYCITYDHEPTLEALNLSLEDMTEEQKEILKKAKENYLKEK